MAKRMTVSSYFRLPESNKPMELVYGFVHEPASPFCSHQSVVGKLFRVLTRHVERYRLGVVHVSPLDVVLDKKSALVVQPDVLFVAKERLDIVRDRVWGSPDLTIEVLSPGTTRRDRSSKLEWYRRYGVTECWLVNMKRASVEVIDLKTNERRSFQARQRIRSTVLPRLATRVDRVF